MTEFAMQQASDWLIALAYFSIPLQLILFLLRFPVPLDRKHKLVVCLFACFISSCGLTHAVHAIVVILQERYLSEHPFSSLEEALGSVAVRGVAVSLLWIKVLCAVVSLLTSLLLLLLIPLFLAGVKYMNDLEEGMRLKLAELDEARAVAELANERKGAFMSFLCHELRNPLTVITANVDFLIESTNLSFTTASGSIVGDDAASITLSGHAQLSRDASAMSSATFSSDEAFAACSARSSGVLHSPPASLTPFVSGSPALSSASGAVHPARGSNSLLFNIPSLPGSASHSRASSTNTPLDAAQLAQLGAAEGGMLQLQEGLEDAAAMLACSTTGMHTPASVGSAMMVKRRTWPSVESTALPPGVGVSGHPSSLPSPYLSCAPVAAPLSLEQRQYLRAINHAAELMVSLCNDVLDIAKLESGVIAFEKLAVDLPLLCESFVHLSAAQAAAKGIAIRMEWEPDVSRYVWCDPTRLNQVFLQLLSNAIKFSRNYARGDNQDGSGSGRGRGKSLTASAGPGDSPNSATSGSPSHSQRGEILFHVRTYHPSRAELDAFRARQSARHESLRDPGLDSPARSALAAAPPLHFGSGRGKGAGKAKGLSLSASSSSASASASSANSKRSWPLTPQSATQIRLLGSSGKSAAQGSPKPGLSLQSASASPTALQPLASSMPHYGARARDESSGSSSGGGHHDRDVDEDGMGDEHRSLLSIHVATSSPSPPSLPAPSPSSASSTRTPFDGFQSHRESATADMDTESDGGDGEHLWLEFSVQDHGVGMTPMQLAHLWEPYSEAKLAWYRSQGGTGLGLSICKQVVTQLGGELFATSVEGEGSTFVVRMRFQVASAEDVLECEAGPSSRSSSNASSRRASYGTGSTQMHSQVLQHAPAAVVATSTATVATPVAPISSVSSSSSSSAVFPSTPQLPPASASIFSPSVHPSPPSGQSGQSSSARSSSSSSSSGAAGATADILGMMSASRTPALTTPGGGADTLPAQLHSKPSDLGGMHTAELLLSSPASSSSSSLPPSGPTPVRPPAPVLLPAAMPSLSSTPRLYSSPLTSGSVVVTPPGPSSSGSAGAIAAMPSPLLPPLPSSATGAQTPGARLPLYRLLVCDDNAVNRRLLHRMMSSLGYEVDTAEDGSQAVEAVRRNMSLYPPPPPLTDASAAQQADHAKRVAEYERNRYSCLILDLSMPVMDGYDAARNIRLLGFTGPIIALTANALTEERNKAYEAGMNEFCTKPIRKHELMALMKHFCGHDFPTPTGMPSLGAPSRQSSSTSPASLTLPPGSGGPSSGGSPAVGSSVVGGISVSGTQIYSTASSARSSLTSSPSPSATQSPRSSRSTQRGSGPRSARPARDSGERPPTSGRSSGPSPLPLPPAADQGRSVSAVTGSMSLFSPSFPGSGSGSGSGSATSTTSGPLALHLASGRGKFVAEGQAAPSTSSSNASLSSSSSSPPPLVQAPSAGSMHQRRALTRAAEEAQLQSQAEDKADGSSSSGSKPPLSITTPPGDPLRSSPSSSPPSSEASGRLVSPTSARRALLAAEPSNAPAPPPSISAASVLAAPSGSPAPLGGSLSPQGVGVGRHMRQRSRGAIHLSPDTGLDLISALAAQQAHEKAAMMEATRSSPSTSPHAAHDSSAVASSNDVELEDVSNNSHSSS